MKVKPVGKTVLIRPDRQEKESPGGIVIPETAKQGKVNLWGTVVAVGRDVMDPVIGEGVRVLYSHLDPELGGVNRPVEHEGETLWIVNYTSLYAVEEGEGYAQVDADAQPGQD